MTRDIDRKCLCENFETRLRRRVPGKNLVVWCCSLRVIQSFHSQATNAQLEAMRTS
jgi:hypothetical protein